MKSFSCSRCNFGGGRKKVRLHLRVRHHIGGLEKNINGERLPSKITPLMVRVEI